MLLQSKPSEMDWFSLETTKMKVDEGQENDKDVDKKDELLKRYPELDELIDELYDDVEKGDLALCDTMEHGDHVVFGKGDANSKIMIIGEAPGLQECLEGEPLVGPSGEMVASLLKEFGMDMCRDTFVTNIVRIFPWKLNQKSYKRLRSPRQPTYKEIKEHVEYLRKLICKIKPRLILTFGSISANVVCNHLEVKRIRDYDDEMNEILALKSIGRMQSDGIHKAFIEGMESAVWVQPLYHPSYFLHLKEKTLKIKRMAAWKQVLGDALEYVKKKPPDCPKPLILDCKNDGWDRNNPVESPWCDPLKTVFFKRPPVPSYADVIARDIEFQMNTFEYVHDLNAFRMIGRNMEGQSVCCTVVENTFDFWIDIPECYRYKSDRKEIIDCVYNDLIEGLHGKGEYYQSINPTLDMEQHDNLFKVRNKHNPIPYMIKVTVQRHWHIRVCSNELRALYSTQRYGLTTYGTDIKPEFMLTYYSRIKASTWLHIDTGKYKLLAIRDTYNHDDRATECDIELQASYKNISPVAIAAIPPQRIGGFDIECSNLGRFPEADKDAIICVSFHCQEENEDTVIEKNGKCKANINYIFTLRKCAQPKDPRDKLFQFNNEVHMLVAIRLFILQYDPDKILGHNIKGFDFKYIINRANYLKLTAEDGWGHFGRIKDVRPTILEEKFSSRAYGEMTVTVIPMEGRAVIDSLEVSRRTMKIGNYTLQSVAREVLGDQKNDMPYVAIPGYFWGSEKDVLELNEYCKKDAALVVWIYNKKKWHYELCEFARINGTISENDIYVKGQQIKVFSCLMHNLIERDQQSLIPTFEKVQEEMEVVEENWMLFKDEDDGETESECEQHKAIEQELIAEQQKEDDDDTFRIAEPKSKQTTIVDMFGTATQKQKIREKIKIMKNNRTKNAVKQNVPGYQGATVLTPELGLKTVPIQTLDFQALYPSIMMWINTCMSTVVYECQLEELGFDPNNTEKDLNCAPIKFLHKGCDKCKEQMVHVYYIKKEYKLTVYESDFQNYKWKSDNPLEELYFVEMGLHPRWRGHEFKDEADKIAHYEKIYKFKDESRGMGALPQTLDMLLKARKAAKREMDKYQPGTQMHSIYNGRQLALKILANSVYGATGVDVGRIAAKTIGATVTAYGRQEIEAARDRALDYFSKGVWKELADRMRGDDPDSMPGCVGGDTDSIFTHYPFTKMIEQAIEFGYRASDYHNQFLEKPMFLDFEKIMFLMMIIAKKRYAANLFAGQNNYYIFEKKRWIELFIEQEKWDAIFRTKDWQMPGVLFSGDEWYKKLETEKARRSAQTDVEWIADYEKPRYINYKVFNPLDHGKFFSRGIETVRRDSCKYLSVTMQNYLEMLMMKGKVIDAIMYVHERIKKLVNGDVPKEQLLMSKQISKEHYKTENLPHLTVVKKMKERGEHPPELGNRCPFFILKPKSHVLFDDPKNKGKKKTEKIEPLYLRAEHPNHVYEHDLDIDMEYYINNQCKKPLMRVLSPVMEDVENIIFDIKSMFEGTYKPSNIKTTAKQSLDSIDKFLIKYGVCQNCTQSFQKDTANALLCSECDTKRNLSKLHRQTNKQLNTARYKYEQQMMSCRKCTNTYKASCNNFECNQYATRKTLERHVKESKTKLSKIESLPDIEDLFVLKKRRSNTPDDNISKHNRPNK